MTKKGNIKSCPHPIIDVYLKEDKTTISSDLAELFNDKISECPHCGGLVPELRLHRDKTMLTFTCIEVQRTAAVSDIEGPKVLQKTDYDKLVYHLLKYGHGPKSFDELMKYFDSAQSAKT
jgi:hypothetical protein